jgi:hypothetical protein
MTENKEHTTVGFNKATIATIVLVIGVLAAMAFWFDRGGTEATAATLHNTKVDGHESRIFGVERDVAKVTEGLNAFKEVVTERFHNTEMMQQSLQKDQEALIKGQDEIKKQNALDAELAREQRKEDTKAIQKLAEVVATGNAYFHSLDNVKPSE